ncbi:TonB-dependent receptor [Leptobacterium flavescens]|uniref:TonB-dependent receptor n=1 Tax=Leptobacterium flavescens TaxID=472055 RepID=A0A6P0UJR9_9FLAO|nr:TonB-dependent receptor [Leptobacterium flavescens]NER12119.1 TonB-dependent receptor [Leptobacterium flavescens]
MIKIKTLTIAKSIFFLAGLLLGSFNIYAQQTIKGKVVDSQNRAALAGVHIQNLSDNSIVISNNSGEFELNSTGTYRFSSLGYEEKEVAINENGYQVVQLQLKAAELNEVIVSTNHLPKKLKKAVATINILSQKEIERGNNFNITPVLNRVPGIFMHNGALNTNRITIRGIGARNLFGTANIRAYFQDIPLTTGSGETTIEDFELTSIARFEVIKGAASSIYGAGLGGTIHLIPQNAYLNQTSVGSELSIGSFGLIKGIVNVNHGTTKNSFRAIYSNTHSDGYRDNNEYDRQTITLTSNHYLGEKDELAFVGSYVDLKAFIPSSLNEDTFRNNPTAAAFTWGQAQGFEDSQRGIFGLSWNHKYSQKLKQTTSVFTSFRDAYEPRPFNILAENTFALGIRSRLLGNTSLFNKPLNWTVGGELFRDWHESETFENLYLDFPIGTGSVEGDQLSDFREKRTYYNIFFETNYDLSEKTTLSVGLNLNKTSYDLDDRFTVTADNPDQSGTYDFDAILSPKFGISHLFTEDISVYSSVSHGFSPPTLGETLLPDGQINTDIQPETGWNFEIGTRGTLINKRLQYNLALYRLDVRNLLVARRAAEDQFIGINAGRTQHDGLELALEYLWVNKKALNLSSYLSYTLNDFVFKEFVDGDDDFSGNNLTGVPSDVFNAGIDFSTAFGLYGNINFQYVGSIPITDSNSLFSDSYSLTNIKVGYRLDLSEKLKLNAFFGLDNVFDEEYASQILINARGFGGNAPRFFYPGNPVNYYTGINANYTF